jgi:hypothetical protein
MKRVGEALIKSGLITSEQLKLALERQVVFGGRIGTNLVELGILMEEELVRFLSGISKVPPVEREVFADIEEETIACISAKLASKYKIVPFRKEKNRLHAAMMDPQDMHGVEELRFLSGYDIIPYQASELRLLYALERYYGLKRDLRFISILEKADELAAKNKKTSPDHIIEKVKGDFIKAGTRQEVEGLIFSEASKVAKRVGLFMVKGGEIQGGPSRELHIKDFRLRPEPPSLFNDVLMRKAYYRGPVLNVPGNQEFIAVLGGAPADSILVPIVIRDRVTCLLYADNGNKGVLNSNISFVNKVCEIASLGFELLIIKKKIMDL